MPPKISPLNCREASSHKSCQENKKSRDISEKSKVTPDTATIAKIDRALKWALKPKKW